MFGGSAEITAFVICTASSSVVQSDRSQAVLSEVRHCCTEEMYNEALFNSEHHSGGF